MYYRSETYNRTRPSGGAWVYYNGELYHAGVKGMKWGKHLPGTTWWKEAVDNYRTANTVYGYQKDSNGNTMPSSKYAIRPSNLKTQFNVARQAIKETAKDFNAAAKWDTSRAARSAYLQNKKAYNGIDGNTYLDKLSKKIYDSGHDYFNSLSASNSSWKNILNLSIRNAGFNIVNGVNQFLKKRGWDVKVDNFLSKILKKRNTEKRDINQEFVMVPHTPTNTRGYERAEAASPTGKSSTKHPTNTRGYERAEAMGPFPTSKNRKKKNIAPYLSGAHRA